MNAYFSLICFCIILVTLCCIWKRNPVVDCGLVSQNAACCRHKNTERTPDTSPVWWKIVICKHHPHLQTQTHAMQTVASCVNTFGLVIHNICWNVAFRGLNLQSESTSLLVGRVAASGLCAWALQQTLLKILLLLLFELECSRFAISYTSPVRVSGQLKITCCTVVSSCCILALVFLNLNLHHITS